MRVLAVLAALVAAAPRPAAPVVVGPRSTALERPVYTFRARGATGFRCAFDSLVLHRCARRYSERLERGPHVLRVRSVGRRGAVSRLVTVRVTARFAVPALDLQPAVPVGAGAGVPAPVPGGAWVPITSDGTVVRVTNGAVAAKVPLGAGPGGAGALDAALADDRTLTQRAVWVASDAGSRITRLDQSGNVTARLDVAARPGGLTNDGRSLWSFHFLQGVVTRVDLATNAVTRFEVPGAEATGIAWRDGSLWLLTTQPAQAIELDPDTGAVRRRIDLRPPFARRRSVVDTWWLADAGGALWATLPNYDAVARIDPATGAVLYVRSPAGMPFGVTRGFGAGSALVATSRAILQLDGTTGALQLASLVPAASQSGFVSVAFGYGSAWLTNYDRGTLVEVRAPSAARNAR